jgi:hypothetical protein
MRNQEPEGKKNLSNGVNGYRSEFGFESSGRQGKVTVCIAPSSERGAEGFPTCTATVEFGAEGYDAFLGWVQLCAIH